MKIINRSKRRVRNIFSPPCNKCHICKDLEKGKKYYYEDIWFFIHNTNNAFVRENEIDIMSDFLLIFIYQN